MYQPIALEIYRNILRHKLHRDVEVRPAGFVIQPNLFWLVAVPSGLTSDKKYSRAIWDCSRQVS